MTKHIVPISQKVVVQNPRGELLALRRSKTAPSNPLKWDLPGGDLEWGEDPIESAKREVREETGLTLKSLTPFDVEAHVNQEGNYWTTIAYVAESERSNVELSYEHDEYKWVSRDEFLGLELPAKIRRFIENFDV